MCIYIYIIPICLYIFLLFCDWLSYLTVDLYTCELPAKPYQLLCAEVHTIWTEFLVEYIRYVIIVFFL